jgi:hypothetical protein
MQANFVISPRIMRKAKRYVPSIPTMDKAILNWSTDQYITGFGATRCHEGDAEYYCTNICDPDFNFDEFNDVDNEYALLTLSDTPDGLITDEDDEFQDMLLCELEYQLNNQ